MLPSSLYWRMVAASLGATLVALALAGGLIGGLLGRVVTEGLDRRLDAEIALLAASVDREGRVDRALLAERAAAFEQGPGWRWRIAGPDGTVGSADMPALDPGPRPPGPPGGPPLPSPPGIAPVGTADHRGARIHARQLVLETRQGPVTLTALAPEDVVRDPVRDATAPLLAGLAGLAALLTLASLVQVRLGLRPLRRLRDEVAAIRSGTRDRVGEDHVSELKPLAVELNALAADTQSALATARASAANLAHALKTPVAALAIDLRDQPRLAAQVQRIDRTIRHHLSRARAQAVNRRVATPLAPAAADVAAAVLRLHPRGLVADVDVPEGLTVAVDGQDLDELLGNLLDNAARYAASRIGVEAAGDGSRARITVSDDGPGIPAGARAGVLQAGTRLDERGDGHGFGLAIVAELTSLYGGALALDDAPGGGLAVCLTLPAAIER